MVDTPLKSYQGVAQATNGLLIAEDPKSALRSPNKLMCANGTHYMRKINKPLGKQRLNLKFLHCLMRDRSEYSTQNIRSSERCRRLCSANNRFSRIYSSTATLTLPDGPSDAGSGYDLSLWVGMGTSDGDLIQSITDNYSEDWTVFAYTLKETSPTSQEVIEGDVAPAAAGDEVTMVCKSNIPGHVVSRLCSSQ
jgi:hypothetical protein